MAITRTLLPILEESEWSGASLAAAERLVRDDAEMYVPLVAYAYDEGSRRAYLTLSMLEDEGRSLESVAKEARANLERRAMAMRPRDDGSRVVIDEYASSMLASPSELERLRADLDASAILLASPTRGLLVAVPRPESGDHGLSRFAREAFASSLDARISPVVFTWDGVSLEVHREVRSEIVESRIDELSYEPDDERIEVEVRGEVGPTVLRVLERLVRLGRTDDGRSVAEIVVRAPADTRAALANRFGEAIELVDVHRSSP